MAIGDEKELKSDQNPPLLIEIEAVKKEESLFAALRRLFSVIFFPDPDTPPSSLLQRVSTAVSDNASSIREGFKTSAQNLLSWTRRGSPLRALLVVSVGTIILLSLTGLLVFMLFFLAATTNAVIISLLISLAAAGGFLALFFACLTTVYVVALSVAIFVISTMTISTIIAVLIATGWVGFLWAIWVAAKKTLDLTKQSLTMTGSALSAYSATTHFPIPTPNNKVTLLQSE